MNNEIVKPASYWIGVVRQRISQHQHQPPTLSHDELSQITRIISSSSSGNNNQQVYYGSEQEVRTLTELMRMLVNMQRSKQQQLMQKSSSSAIASPALSSRAQSVLPVSSSASSGAASVSQQQSSHLNAEQMNLLRMQIMAFKYLSKNIPIPAQVQQVLFSLTSNKNNAGSSLKQSDDSQDESVANYDNESVVMSDPYTHLKSVGAKGGLHRVLIPSIMPSGLDPIAMAQERERRIRNKIAFRILQLENLPANMSNDRLSNSLLFSDEKDGEKDAVDNQSSLKLKALIELKMLRLVEKQKKVRAEVVSGLKAVTTLQTAVSRCDYRRVKKPSLREIKYTEKMEKQHRMEKEKKEKSKHLEFLNGIINHGRDMIAKRKAVSAKGLKLGRAVMNWHVNTEKEEQKRKERMAKERIKALKADDEEAYLRLIDKQKDTRLTHLLQQTDEYLSKLSSLVAAQQADTARREGVVMEPVPELETADEDGDKTDYYSIAHRVRETVTEQPKILVGGTLKEYQIKGLEWMVSLYNNKLNGILADEMGLGKTIQTISLVSYLIEKKNQNGPFLIIVPLSTITNWSAEFEKWAPSIQKVVYKGSPNQRRDIQVTEMRQATFNVLLTTYEYIIKDKAFLSKFKWIHTIIDEGHRMKNASSKLSTTLCQYYSSRYRLILTGTPLQNNLPELWALLNFILPKIFNSVKTFDDWFNTPFAATGEKIEVNEEEQLLIIKRLHKVLRPFLLRRLKKEVEKDLPNKTERILKTPLSAIQQKLYSQVRQSGAMMIHQTDPNGKKISRSINNTIMQLRKICNHPYVFPEVEDALNPNTVTDMNIVRTSGKFELLDRMLPKFKATGHRVLIFFQMTAVMDIMEDFLRWRDHKFMRLDGSTKTEDRSAMLKLFNAPDSQYFVFILSTRAGGLGLNLQSADTVIIFDSDWNPHQDLQAQDRAHRIGQKKEVRIYRLISANSIEETILARAQHKLDIDGKVIQAGKFDNKSTNEERDQFLKSLFEADPEDNNDVNDVEEDDELNELLARSDEELEMFRKIDAQRTRDDVDYWRSLGKYGKYTRLMQVDELPEIYLHDVVPEQKVDVTVEYGRGQRQRGDVRYDDGLTEDQWAKAIDREEDIEKIIEKKKSRSEKKRQSNVITDGSETGTAPAGSGSELSSDESDSDNDDAQESSAKRVRIEEPEKEPEAPPPTMKKIKIVNRGLAQQNPPPNQQLKSLFESVFKQLEEYHVQDSEGNERYCSDLFLELPSRKLYPDYYSIIQNPIAMDIISSKIQNDSYRSLQDFKHDFDTMITNAMTYNQEGSIVYEDALALKQVFENAIRSATGGTQQ